MKLTRRGLIVGALGASQAGRILAQPQNRFAIEGDHFVLNGKPFQILSGSMHYPRVPRVYWRDRMRKARALGLNTICTYVFWNLHEPEPGRFDFSGNLDVAAYIRTAQEEGLLVILRPGPYICAEWEFGGFPAWLLFDPEMEVRSSNPKFLAAADRYLRRVGEELAPLQITKGGPIVLCQVENEYGSFGADAAYKNAIRTSIQNAGFDVQLYTSDGPTTRQLSGGSFPDLPPVINFGAGAADRHFEVLASFRSGIPQMCGEYWVGWFDHWGETHHTVTPQEVIQGYEWMISRGISVNMYMFHGGTTFGFMSGANNDTAYQPDITSYDYDAPLDEAGRPTAKFFAIQKAIRNRTGQQQSALPDPLSLISIPPFEFSETAALFSHLPKPVISDRPKTMEELRQSYGYVLYRTQIRTKQSGTLSVPGVRDYAVVLKGSQRLAVLDRRLKQTSIPAALDAGDTLNILVENMGRTNFGPHLQDDRKGILGDVVLNEPLTQWEHYSLPLNDLSDLQFSSLPVEGPAFYHARFNLENTGDTFFDMRGWGKGVVWVNGHNLGRYWNQGPQRTLFVPADCLKAGANEAIILELSSPTVPSITGIQNPIWDRSSDS